MTDPVLVWQRADCAPELGVGDLHLWRIETGDRGAALEDCRPLLGDRQRARAERMLHAPTRERYLRSQAAMRRILGIYVGAGPGDIVYAHGPAGKPELAGDRHWLRFNLTTTGDLALVGLSRGAELGLDCEWIRQRRGIEGVARRMFGLETSEALAALPESERLAAFCRAWTALEADAKCDGRGLFRPRATGAPVPQIAHFVPAPGYIAAVARAELPPLDRWVAFRLDAIAADSEREADSPR